MMNRHTSVVCEKVSSESLAIAPYGRCLLFEKIRSVTVSEFACQLTAAEKRSARSRDAPDRAGDWSVRMPLTLQDLEAIQGDVIPHPLTRPMRLSIS